MNHAMNNEPRTMNKRWLSVTTFMLCAYCLLLSASSASAQVPHLIRYQGTAVDSKGVPLEGPYTLTFRLYDAATVGTKIWEEVQPNVPISKGNFSVLLGQVTPLTAMDWGLPCWLSVQVNTDPELAPRQQITSVPLAIRAQTAEVVKTSGLTDDAHSLVPSGAIILWDGASCPTGYTRLSTYDGKMLRGAATAGGTGGSDTHQHEAGSYAGPLHSHFVNASGGTSTSTQGGSTLASTYAHTHGTSTDGGGPVTGTSAPASSLPAYREIVLCKKD